MSGQFLTTLKVERVGEDWMLLDVLRYRSEVVAHIIEVPKGFLTDFASVPRIPIAYWLTGDTAHAPSVVHDYLYRNRIGKRSKADAIFYEAMIADGEARWRAYAMWAAVRISGVSTW